MIPGGNADNNVGRVVGGNMISDMGCVVGGNMIATTEEDNVCTQTNFTFSL